MSRTSADSKAMSPSIETVAEQLLDYCQRNDWAGYDPYDALNSKILKAIPSLGARFPRLILTQVLKRSPIDIRGICFVPKTQNPKAIGLFLAAVIRLSKAGLAMQHDLAEQLIEKLRELRSRDVAYWCWGYSFPWQTRTVLVPAGAPNLVCTTFVGNALLDAYEERQDLPFLNMAVSAAEYLLRELYWSSGESVAGFSYPLPGVRNQVPNANFLAAALLCRVARCTGEMRFLGPALKVARTSAAMQNLDGSWYYGEVASQHWIDNFHTGYNLCALRAISQYAETTEFDSCMQRGFAFYKSHFFRHDAAAKYYHNRVYPIDIHCVAQSIITLLTFKDLDSESVASAHSVLRWAVNNMWDERGFFYYRVLRACTIRTSYMRWSQAWMLLAIATLVAESRAISSQMPACYSAALN
jgi:hypothetical protein